MTLLPQAPKSQVLEKTLLPQAPESPVLNYVKRVPLSSWHKDMARSHILVPAKESPQDKPWPQYLADIVARAYPSKCN